MTQSYPKWGIAAMREQSRLPEHVVGRCRSAFDNQRRDGVERIEEEMWVKLQLQRPLSRATSERLRIAHPVFAYVGDHNRGALARKATGDRAAGAAAPSPGQNRNLVDQLTSSSFASDSLFTRPCVIFGKRPRTAARQPLRSVHENQGDGCKTENDHKRTERYGMAVH